MLTVYLGPMRVVGGGGERKGGSEEVSQGSEKKFRRFTPATPFLKSCVRP